MTWSTVRCGGGLLRRLATSDPATVDEDTR